LVVGKGLLQFEIITVGALSRCDRGRLAKALLKPHQADNVWEIALVGFVLEQARSGPGRWLAGPERRAWLQVFKILEDLSRIEDLEVSVDQHRDLAFGVDPQHVRVLRLVEVLHVERHHDEVEVQTFLQSSDLSLRPKHAQGAGEQAHTACRATGITRLPLPACRTLPHEVSLHAVANSCQERRRSEPMADPKQPGARIAITCAAAPSDAPTWNGSRPAPPSRSAHSDRLSRSR